MGKTKLSLSLAKALNGSIISADSMQVYKHMDIGSAKICPEEMEGEMCIRDSRNRDNTAGSYCRLRDLNDQPL